MERAVNLFKTLFFCFALSFMFLPVNCCATSPAMSWNPFNSLPAMSLGVYPVVKPTEERLSSLPVYDEYVALELAKKYLETTDYPEIADFEITEMPGGIYYYKKGNRSLFGNGRGVFSKSQEFVFIVTYEISSESEDQWIDFAVFQNTGFVRKISRSEFDAIDTGMGACYSVFEYLGLGKVPQIMCADNSNERMLHTKFIDSTGTHLVNCEGEYLTKDTQEFVFLVTHTEYTSETKDQVKTKEQYAVVKKTGKVKKITFDQLKPMPQKEQPQKIS